MPDSKTLNAHCSSCNDVILCFCFSDKYSLVILEKPQEEKDSGVHAELQAGQVHQRDILQARNTSYCC